MRDLQPTDVAPLYKAQYWDRVKGDQLPAGVDYAVFDAAINSGAGRAARWLQECVGTQPDGAIGPLSLQAANAMVAADLINIYCDKRLSFMKGLQTWDVFGKGWERRVEEVRSAALKMV
jgi:lysozyme family protein